MIEQLKELTDFEFCNVTVISDCDSYQFGWKDWLHFYVDDYYFNTEHEGQYMMVVWLNKKLIYNHMFFNKTELLTEIKTVLCKFQK